MIRQSAKQQLDLDTARADLAEAEARFAESEAVVDTEPESADEGVEAVPDPVREDPAAADLELDREDPGESQREVAEPEPAGACSDWIEVDV